MDERIFLALKELISRKTGLRVPSDDNALLEKIILERIGSTGGPQALARILARLPADFPAPIACVQHISEGFLTGLIDWLDAMCSLKIAVAGGCDLPKPGSVYFPVVFGMPGKTIGMGAAALILPLDEIAAAIASNVSLNDRNRKAVRP